MSSTQNKGAWDGTYPKDDSPVVKAKIWALLRQTPWMALMVPHQHRLEVLMLGVINCGTEVGPWLAPKMARSCHEALWVSFSSADC